MRCRNRAIVKTRNHTEFVEITDQVQPVLNESGVKEGACICFVRTRREGKIIKKEEGAFYEEFAGQNDPTYRVC